MPSARTTSPSPLSPISLLSAASGKTLAYRALNPAKKFLSSFPRSRFLCLWRCRWHEQPLLPASNQSNLSDHRPTLVSHYRIANLLVRNSHSSAVEPHTSQPKSLILSRKLAFSFIACSVHRQRKPHSPLSLIWTSS